VGGVSRRELLAKALVYRLWVTLVELALASLLKSLAGIDVVAWVLVVNALKAAAYFGFDLGWFSLLRRLVVLRRVRGWLGVEA